MLEVVPYLDHTITRICGRLQHIAAAWGDYVFMYHFNDDGNIIAVTQRRRGRLHGEQLMYAPDGNIRCKMIYTNGRIIPQWEADLLDDFTYLQIGRNIMQ